MQATALRDIRVLRTPSAGQAVGVGATFNQPKVNVGGLRRLKGSLTLAAGGAPAAGFPRVRQSPDGINFTRTDVLVQDASQLPLVAFPVDIAIECPYVAIEFTNGAGASTLFASVWALPE